MELFSTAYFAPIIYYHHYANSVDPVIEIKEHFVKQTVRTRCEILGPNGKQLLSIPVDRINGSKTVVEDLKIVEDGWRKIHWKTIETAYSSSAFFDYYGMEIKELIEKKTVWLVDFNNAIHQRILSWLDITIPTKFTNEYIKSLANDFRNVKFDTASDFIHERYHQVFCGKEDCLYNLSILDLILNEGPLARRWVIQG